MEYAEHRPPHISEGTERGNRRPTAVSTRYAVAGLMPRYLHALSCTDLAAALTSAVVDPYGRWLAWTLTALAWCAALFIEGANSVLGATTGLQHIGDPLARTALLVAAWSAPVLLMTLTSGQVSPSAVRRRAFPSAAGVAVLWVAYLTAGPASLLRSRALDVEPDARFLVYTFTTLAALTVALVEVAVGARTYAATATGPLRVGVRLVSLGCLLGVAYVVTKAVTTAAAYTHPQLAASTQSSLGRALAVSAGLTVAAGCLTPSVCKLWRTARATTWAYLVHARLYPLWRTATAAVPGIALNPAPTRVRDLLRVRAPDLLLYRRIVELRDAQLALAADLPSDPPQRHAALDLASALDATAPAGSPSREVRVADAGPDLTLREEAVWWLDVARALSTQPAPPRVERQREGHAVETP